MSAIILSLLVCTELPLDEALRRLDEANPTLQQAQARAREAEGLARQALAAALPQLAVNGSYTRNSQEARAPLGQLASLIAPAGAAAPQDLIIQPLEAWSVSASARLPIVMPAAWLDYAATLAGADAAKTSARQARAQLRQALMQAAWLERAAREIVGASERALASAEEHATSATRAAMAGTGTPLTALQAQTEAVRRKSDLAQARVEAERIARSIGVLLGADDPVSITGELTIAADGRFDVSAARGQVLAASRQVTAAWLRHVPTLIATGAAFKQSVALPTGRDDGWRIGLELTWTIYDGGARYGRLAQAEATRAGAEAALRATQLRAAQDVSDARAQAQLANERLGLALDQQRLASEAAATATRGFAAGVSSAQDVRDANDRLYQSDVAVANARARVGTARVALEFAASGDPK